MPTSCARPRSGGSGTASSARTAALTRSSIWLLICSARAGLETRLPESRSATCSRSAWIRSIRSWYSFSLSISVLLASRRAARLRDGLLDVRRPVDVVAPVQCLLQRVGLLHGGVGRLPGRRLAQREPGDGLGQVLLLLEQDGVPLLELALARLSQVGLAEVALHGREVEADLDHPGLLLEQRVPLGVRALVHPRARGAGLDRRLDDRTADLGAPVTVHVPHPTQQRHQRVL